jgi:type II secretory pathway pseudopilin PulG
VIVNPYRTHSITRVSRLGLSRSVSGFTLVEIALVLLIVTVLLGYTVSIYPAQQEVKQYRTANEEMSSIIKYLIRFAQINGRLPCPYSTIVAPAPGFEGKENTDTSVSPWVCTSGFSYLPGKSLGILGDYDNQGRLLDPWGMPYLYAVSDGTVAGAVAGDDFVDRDNIKSLGLSGMVGDIHICDDSPVLGDQTSCPVGIKEVMSRVAAVVISTGKDEGSSSSNIQAENQDNFNVATTRDRIFVYTQRRDRSGVEYDDLIKWLPTNLLLSKLVEVGRLP